jgi:hypothetical protein
MGLKDYTDDEGRLTEDGSHPDAMAYVHYLIKRLIEIVTYDSNRVIISKPPLSTVGRHRSGILIEYLARTHITEITDRSVTSLNPCPSVIQTNYDIVKADGGEMKAETKEGNETTFIVQIPSQLK